MKRAIHLYYLYINNMSQQSLFITIFQGNEFVGTTSIEFTHSVTYLEANLCKNFSFFLYIISTNKIYGEIFL